ncbi:MAG: peptide chain release factor N(5)-glutamine methyltransferase [Candidatus Omnitrophica bacterium]|nr:peptide chain release factor N(5)-glutamine methyltransferase [Candidatus Omnitrophota bacterium]
MRLKEWVEKNRDYFLRSDLAYLINLLFHKDMVRVYVDDYFLNAEQLDKLNYLKSLYIKGIPLAYLLGQEEFYGFTFQVNFSTLIPRKDTEVIVEKALELIKIKKLSFILDLCCGSANIAVSIAKYVENYVKIFASDISENSLEIGKVNIEHHRVPVKLIRADLLAGFKENVFDLIISNPPYVESKYIKDSLDYEPRIALDGGADGLKFIRRILNEAWRYLKNERFIIVEFGYRQRGKIEEFLKRVGKYFVEEWIKDYSSKWRGVILKVNK